MSEAEEFEFRKRWEQEQSSGQRQPSAPRRDSALGGFISWTKKEDRPSLAETAAKEVFEGRPNVVSPTNATHMIAPTPVPVGALSKIGSALPALAKWGLGGGSVAYGLSQLDAIARRLSRE